MLPYSFRQYADPSGVFVSMLHESGFISSVAHDERITSPLSKFSMGVSLAAKTAFIQVRASRMIIRITLNMATSLMGLLLYTYTIVQFMRRVKKNLF
jgi:hypothetical protein